jgi:hypothetical protein
VSVANSCKREVLIVFVYRYKARDINVQLIIASIQYFAIHLILKVLKSRPPGDKRLGGPQVLCEHCSG